MAVRRNVLTTGTARPGPAGAAMALRWKEFSHDDALGDDSLPSTPGQPPRVPVAWLPPAVLRDTERLKGWQADTASSPTSLSAAPRGASETPHSFFPSADGTAASSALSGLLTSDASDACDASGMDEADGAPDNGSASMAGEYRQRPQSLFSESRPRTAGEQTAESHASDWEDSTDGDTVGRTAGSRLRQRQVLARGAGGEPTLRPRPGASKVSAADAVDDLIDGVGGPSWRRKRSWTAMRSPLFAWRGSASPFGDAATEPAPAGRRGAPGTRAPASDHDDDADGDVSECEFRHHSTPDAHGSRARAPEPRTAESMGERVRSVAVRARELAASVGEHWQQRAKRRHAKAQRHPVRSDMILLPGGNIRRAWDCLGLVLLWLVLLLQVCNARWKSEHKGWIFWDMEQPYNGAILRLQVLLDLFFIADIFVNFRTAYLDEKTGKYVKDAWKIAAHYSRHWLLCDLFCAIPLDVLLDEAHPVAMNTQRKKGKTRLKWLLRRTGALHMLRVAAETRPFKGARCVSAPLQARGAHCPPRTHAQPVSSPCVGCLMLSVCFICGVLLARRSVMLEFGADGCGRGCVRACGVFFQGMLG